MPAPGTVWAGDTWDADAWAANTWAGAAEAPNAEIGAAWGRPLWSWVRTWRYLVPNTFPAPTLTKTVSDDRDYCADFSDAPELEDGSVSISSAVATVVSGGTGLTVGTPAVNTAAFDGIPIGKGVVVRISGGTDDLTAKLHVVATLSNGRKLTAPLRLVITADAE